MKIAEPTLALSLTERLEASLHGLSEKHARQMHKKVAGSARKLAQDFAHLLAKEQRARDKQQRRATKESIQQLVLKLHLLLAQPAAEASHRTRLGTQAA